MSWMEKQASKETNNKKHDNIFPGLCLLWKVTIVASPKYLCV